MSEILVGARVNHPVHGEGVVMAASESSLKIFFSAENIREIGRSFQGLTLLENGEDQAEKVTPELIEGYINKAFAKFTDSAPLIELGEKWKRGVLVVQPFNAELQEKEIPVETFFHKIVMLRDRLRVLEQNINSHPKLDDEDRVHLQQYITRIYGSLTSFNFLFKHKEDHFVGEGGKG